MAETLRLAEHVANMKLSDIPEKFRGDLKALVYDYLGVAARGSTTDAAQVAAKFHQEYGGGKEESTLIATGGKATSQAAAFANAVASHSIELDDVDHLALYHFSPPIVSAALAAAEAADASGEEFLLAVGVGAEVMARLSDATNPMLRDRGFHTTPTCGVFGAAAAVAKIEGLSVSQIASAFGIAGAHAAGLMEMYGPSMQKRINPGPAAHNGVVAARMAKFGYTGADTIFEGERGFLKAFAGQQDPSVLVKNLGTDYPVYIEFKPYACARPIHNAIDCAMEIRKKLGDRLSEISEMTIWRHPMWSYYHRIAEPRTYHEAQVSLNHGVAVAFVEGKAFLDQFADEWIQHPQVQRLSRMLRFEDDETLPRGVSCKLRVTLQNGESFESQVDYPKGSQQNPMSVDEHRAKFENLAAARYDRDRMKAIQEAAEGIETLESVRQLTRLLA